MAARRVLHRLACTLGTLLDLCSEKGGQSDGCGTLPDPTDRQRSSEFVIEVDDQSRQLQALTEGLLVPPPSRDRHARES